MGMLKKLKRKSPSAKGINEIAEKIKLVNNLISLGLLQLNDKSPYAYIYPEIWAGKDEAYKKNWCANVFLTWSLLYKKTPEEIRGLDFTVFDKDGNLMGRYNDREGFRG